MIGEKVTVEVKIRLESIDNGKLKLTIFPASNRGEIILVLNPGAALTITKLLEIELNGEA